MTTNYNENFINNLLHNCPRDRNSINAMARSLYCLSPEINNIINRNALLPAKYLQINKTKDKKINQFWETQFENIDIKLILEHSMKEYWTLGETFIYAELEEKSGMWSRLMIQNPDYILVKKNITSTNCEYFLRPDENLRRIILSKKPEDIEQTKQISAKVVKGIKEGKNILLDNFNISCFSNKMSPYDIRGNSPLIPIFALYANQENKITEVDIKNIRNLLFDIDFSTAAYMRHCQTFSFLENWLSTKIVAPISKIQKFTLSPTITFDRKLFKKDIETIKS
jgi:hypothetical protein